MTGHMCLTPATEDLVRDALGTLLAGRTGDGRRLVGVSCLAPGADTIFAEAVLGAGGELVAVLPSRDYRDRTVPPEHASSFDRLLAAATEITVLPFDTAEPAAFEAANARLVSVAQLLVAVWDGLPSAKGGGTASAVATARRAGVPVAIVWPEGAERAPDR
ncbi:hypothetical protein GCM10010440_10180 [Kitasatospora cinereorecta]